MNPCMAVDGRIRSATLIPLFVSIPTQYPSLPLPRHTLIYLYHYMDERLTSCFSLDIFDDFKRTNMDISRTLRLFHFFLRVTLHDWAHCSRVCMTFIALTDWLASDLDHNFFRHLNNRCTFLPTFATLEMLPLSAWPRPCRPFKSTTYGLALSFLMTNSYFLRFTW